MALPSWPVARARDPDRGLRVAVGALWLTAWDLALDPAMSHLTPYWRWDDRGAYYGMPWTNLLGWYATGLVLMVVLDAMGARLGLDRLPGTLDGGVLRRGAPHAPGHGLGSGASRRGTGHHGRGRVVRRRHVGVGPTGPGHRRWMRACPSGRPERESVRVPVEVDEPGLRSADEVGTADSRRPFPETGRVRPGWPRPRRAPCALPGAGAGARGASCSGRLVAWALVPPARRAELDRRFWYGALAIQMVHEASLLHDDILDDAGERRGAATRGPARGWARPGAGRPLPHGRLPAAAAARAPRFLDGFIRAVERTVAGEVAAGPGHRRTAPGRQRYLEMVVGKSGELFGAAACLGGAMLGHRRPGRPGRVRP